MEYVIYILCVLVIGLLSLILIRTWTGKNDKSENLRSGSSRRPKATAPQKVDPRTRLILQRESRPVPTPWGWPRHIELSRDDARPVLSEMMLSLTDRLIRQKELVDSSSANPRVSGSVRALLEDRYGPVERRAMKTIEYRQVKAPLLRDPSEPYDQMNDFGSRELKPVRNKMQIQSAMRSGLGKVVKNKGQLTNIDLKDVKLPWGW